ncbi:MAG: hypothetical protein F4018_14015 [Acidobacteria bacterium]|nr:hypothetical protein [Acidobacteriota bacterium]
MRTNRAVAALGAAVLLAAVPLSGHHAFSAEFDIEQPLTLEGQLVKWELIHPNSWFHIDGEAEVGTTSTWLVEGGSPNELIRQGVNRNTVEVGTFLAVEGYRAKDGTEKAVGRNFILENGERLFLGGSANRAGGIR